MKAVLLSVRPEWREKIVNGQKTIEVRKSKPELETPFKCYIYCTKRPPALWKDGKEIFIADKDFHWLVNTPEKLNGKVIGEFVCGRVERYVKIGGAGISPSQYMYADENFYLHPLQLEQMAMSYKDFLEYAGGQEVYGWHISELKVYDEPKKLITAAPQSWRYVEEPF